MSSWSKMLAEIERVMTTRGWSSITSRRLVSGKPGSGSADTDGQFWPGAVAADTADVELSALAHGQAARVLCVGPGSDEGPCFIRIGWGDLTVAPEIWAVIRGVSLEVTVGDGTRELPSFQVAGGANQLQLGVGLWASDEDFSFGAAIVDRAFETFDSLCAGLCEAGQAGWGTLVRGFDPFSARAGRERLRASKAALPIGWGLLALSAAGTAAAFIVDPVIGLVVLTNVAPFGLTGGLVAIALHQRDRAPRATKAISRLIRACPAFDEHEPPGVLQPLRPVVFVGSGAGWVDRERLVAPTFGTVILAARSTRHRLAFALSLQSLSTNESIHPLCRVVPRSWAVVELTGPDAILDRIRPRRSEQRQAGVLRVVLDEPALEGGGLEEILMELAEIKAPGPSGPYR